MSDTPAPDRLSSRQRTLTDATSRLHEWVTADPKNLVALLTVPLVIWESVAEVRWHRSARRRGLSNRGLLAYARARPGRFAYSLALSLLPEIVGLVSRRRRSVR